MAPSSASKLPPLPQCRKTETKSFYPENLYKVIADFQEKHQTNYNQLDSLESEKSLSVPFDLGLPGLDESQDLFHDCNQHRFTPQGKPNLVAAEYYQTTWGNLPTGPNKKPSASNSTTVTRDPFPRLAAQTVRCKACCERLDPSVKEQPDRTSPKSDIGGLSARAKSDMTNRRVQFMRQSYSLSHFDDTYSSNEFKRNKIVPASKYIPHNNTPRWRI